MNTLIYPGTFDPPTRGHIHLIERAQKLCDTLYIAVAIAHHKSPLFTLEERCALLKENLNPKYNSQIIPFDGLLINLCAKLNCYTILRGLRNSADLNYEQQLESLNRHLNPKIETLYLSALPEQHFISSSLLRESAKLGGDISALLPEKNHAKILEKLKK